jgi:D-serine deaminase-like pyridoxal phosphate-dependent protein
VVSGLLDAGLLPDDCDAILTAGGSGFFDQVVDVLAPGWGLQPPVRVVLCSGCYLTHDHGGYQRMSPLDAQRVPGGLRPAIEVWGRVLSHPARWRSPMSASGTSPTTRIDPAPSCAGGGVTTTPCFSTV